MTMQYGNINYDVPNSRKSHYAKLRALFRRTAIMQTYSSYLIPWSKAADIEKGIEKINRDEDGFPLPQDQQVRYTLFKYDEKISGKALAQSAEMALRRQMASMKSKINEKVQSLFLEEEDENTSDPIASAKVTARRASATLRDARALALMFGLTDDLEAAFLAYEAYIEAKKEEIKDYEEAAKLTDDLEVDLTPVVAEEAQPQPATVGEGQ